MDLQHFIAQTIHDFPIFVGTREIVKAVRVGRYVEEQFLAAVE